MRLLVDYIHEAWRWFATWGTLPVLTWIKAAALYKRGQFEAAARFYTKGLLASPRHPARVYALADVAFCYFKIQEIQKAQDCIREVLSVCPSHISAYTLLSQIQLWSGCPCDAAQTLKESFRYEDPDTQRLGLFLYSIIEYDGPIHLLDEALMHSKGTHISIDDSSLLQVAVASLLYRKSQHVQAEKILDEVLSAESSCIEASILKAEVLLSKQDVVGAIEVLQSGFRISPQHPRLLSLMSELYLRAGETFNAEYGLQLAINACQSSGWRSIRELHILAECYYHTGERAEALMIAQLAREIGAKTRGTYKNVSDLEKLIESLSASETHH